MPPRRNEILSRFPFNFAQATLPFPHFGDARQKWLRLRALSGRPPKYTRRGEPSGRPKISHICSFLRLKIMIHSPYGSIIAGSQSRQATDALRRKLALYPGPVARLPRCRYLRPCAGIPKSYRPPPAFCPFRLENRVFCPKSIFQCPTLSVSGNKQTENKYSLEAALC